VLNYCFEPFIHCIVRITVCLYRVAQKTGTYVRLNFIKYWPVCKLISLSEVRRTFLIIPVLSLKITPCIIQEWWTKFSGAIWRELAAYWVFVSFDRTTLLSLKYGILPLLLRERLLSDCSFSFNITNTWFCRFDYI